MAPSPEAENMTIKRLEVALKRADFKLLKDGAYKLHEKFHSGHYFEDINSLREIYENVVANYSISSDIRDILIPTIEDIFSSQSIPLSKDEVRNADLNRVSTLTSLSYGLGQGSDLQHPQASESSEAIEGSGVLQSQETFQNLQSSTEQTQQVLDTLYPRAEEAEQIPQENSGYIEPPESFENHDLNNDYNEAQTEEEPQQQALWQETEQEQKPEQTIEQTANTEENLENSNSTQASFSDETPEADVSAPDEIEFPDEPYKPTFDEFAPIETVIPPHVSEAPQAEVELTPLMEGIEHAQTPPEVEAEQNEAAEVEGFSAGENNSINLYEAKEPAPNGQYGANEKQDNEKGEAQEDTLQNLASSYPPFEYKRFVPQDIQNQGGQSYGKYNYGQSTQSPWLDVDRNTPATNINLREQQYYQEKQQEGQQKTITIFFGQTFTKEKTRNIEKLKKLIEDNYHTETPMAELAAISKELYIQANAPVVELQTLLEQLKNKQNKINIVTNSQSSDLINVLENNEIKYTLFESQEDKNVNLVPFFGLINNFKCTDCNGNHLNKTPVASYFVQCPNCKGLMYPELYSPKDINIHYYNIALRAIAAADIFVLVHPLIDDKFTMDMIRYSNSLNNNPKNAFIIERDINTKDVYKKILLEANPEINVNANINATEALLSAI